MSLVADHLQDSMSSYSPTKWKRIPPFTKVKFEGEKIIAEYEGTFYEVASIGGGTNTSLIKASRKHFGELWQKRIREDIADPLIAAGFPESDSVGLELKDLKTGSVKIVPDAKMTNENRSKIVRGS